MEPGPGNYVLTLDGTGDLPGPYAFRLLDLSAAKQFFLGSR